MGSKMKLYSSNDLEKALKEVVTGKLSLNVTTKKYNIPRRTLQNRYHGWHVKDHGGQTVFSQHEESLLEECLLLYAEWHFPLDLQDLRFLAKSYLDTKGIVISKFRNNIPGEEWARSFMERHKGQLTQHLANNIKRAHAAVDETVLPKYHQKVSKNLEGLSA
ncbi:hypothetical protein PR048_008920 [Dryococelus australis]|uniref:HTH psq-type domain-containing protein n=1 Tax=Dryococelus australis TaxID=614101 RepID=A0ABQ9HYG4_9NEOP|nr:hypothetical protein PR048_008920 [Dryococelus australis]